MSHKIFKIDKKGNLSLINSEIALTKEFRKLQIYAINNSVDFFKLWRYIYEIADYDSRGNRNGLSAKELHLAAIDSAGLPDNWKPNSIITDAIKRYKLDNYNPVIEERNALLSTFDLYPKVINKIRLALEDSISDDTTEADKIITYLDKINNISSAYPKLVENLVKALAILESKVGVKTRRGGGIVRDSML